MSNVDLNQIAGELLASWRLYLLSSRAPDDSDESDLNFEESGIGHYIDIIETFDLASLTDHPDVELASPIRLLVWINHVMGFGLQEPEHHIVLDAHETTLMRLANIMRGRGLHYTLPYSPRTPKRGRFTRRDEAGSG